MVWSKVQCGTSFMERRRQLAGFIRPECGWTEIRRAGTLFKHILSRKWNTSLRPSMNSRRWVAPGQWVHRTTISRGSNGAIIGSNLRCPEELVTLLLPLGCITDKLSASGRLYNDHWSCVTGDSVAFPVLQREWCVMVNGEQVMADDSDVKCTCTMPQLF